MRKWGLLIMLFLAIATACLYLVIPGKIVVSDKDGVNVNAKAFTRTFLEEEKWKKWWPGEAIPNESKHFGTYRYNGFLYSILQKKLSSVVISIKNDKDSFLSELIFLPVRPDSVSLSWQGIFPTSLHPVNRLQQFFATKRIKQDLGVVLTAIRKFYSDEANVYGLRIVKDHVVDSTLISTTLTTPDYPSTEKIYKLIDQLKTFAQNKGARQTGLPMLHITTTDSAAYLIKVALPVDKKLKDEGNVAYRWMLGGGNILLAEVKGGPHTIKSGFEMLEKYTEDHNRVAPAIPFQSIVTDRLQEPDTSKWITKLYWPVM